MKREEKTPTFSSAGPKYGLRFVKKLCTHVQEVLGVVAMRKDEGQGCNASYCWPDIYSLLNSKSPLICIVGKQQKIHKPITELLLFRRSTGVILRDAFPALERLCCNGPFED